MIATTTAMSEKVCLLCGSDEVNNSELGELKECGAITVHYYCLLLSPALLTNGEENEGILGFMPKDIKLEVGRIKRLKCCYCKKVKANIGCSVSSCRNMYHTRCGLQAGCLMQFTDLYKSFCPNHVKAAPLKSRHSANETCKICYDEMGSYHSVESILSPCCKRDWFHKSCLQEFAINAGYFFKCPLCNNTDEFREAVKFRGIFVPDKDAAWELEPNAFSELLESSESCSAEHCTARNGRDKSNAKNKFMRCYTCGSRCIHRKCWKSTVKWTCTDCVVTPQNSSPASQELDGDNDTEIDVERQSDEDEKITNNEIEDSSLPSSSSSSNTDTKIKDEPSDDLPLRVTQLQELNNSYMDEGRAAAVAVSTSTSSDVELVEVTQEEITVSSDDEQPQVIALKRPRDEPSPRQRISPSKKIRRTLALMKNQSKITSFFSVRAPPMATTMNCDLKKLNNEAMVTGVSRLDATDQIKSALARSGEHRLNNNELVES